MYFFGLPASLFFPLAITNMAQNVQFVYRKCCNILK